MLILDLLNSPKTKFIITDLDTARSQEKLLMLNGAKEPICPCCVQSMERIEDLAKDQGCAELEQYAGQYICLDCQLVAESK